MDALTDGAQPRGPGPAGSIESIHVGRLAAGVLIGAARLVERRPKAVAGTDHLMVSLALRSRILGNLLGDKLGVLRKELKSPGPEPAIEHIAEAGVDASDVDREVDGVLREVHWLVFGVSAIDPTTHRRRPPAFSAFVRSAVRQALVNARSAHLPCAGPPQLRAAVLADDQFAAHRLLRRAGIDPAAVRETLTKSLPAGADDEPWTPGADSLRRFGLAAPFDPSMFSKLALWFGGGKALSYVVEMEATRQTVRLGHAQVTTAHVLLALLALEEQVAVSKMDDDLDRVAVCGGATVLTTRGITFGNVLKLMARLPFVPGLAAAPHRKRAWRTKPSFPSWAAGAAEAMEQARRAAEESTHEILRASMADPAGDAVELVRALGFDPAVIIADLAS